eukprot:jgi/Galph1/4857/GphlegSOOS_G3517.1
MAAGFFRGTSFEQDTRFSNKWKKLLESTKFPDIYTQYVNIKLVKLEAIRSWISNRLQQLLGFEDEVVAEFVFSYLESSENPDPREMHLSLSGFLEDKTEGFMKELWSLLLEAQNEATVSQGKVVSAGVPRSLLEWTKKEFEERRKETETLESLLRQQVGNVAQDRTDRSEDERHGRQLPLNSRLLARVAPQQLSTDAVQYNSKEGEEPRSSRRHRRRRSRSVSKERHPRDRSSTRRRKRSRSDSRKRRHHRSHRRQRDHRHHSRESLPQDHTGSRRRRKYEEENSTFAKGSKEKQEQHEIPFMTEPNDRTQPIEKEENEAVEDKRKDQTRDSLLAELARVERESELRRKALESMKMERNPSS